MVPCSIDSLDGNAPILLLGPIEIKNYIIPGPCLVHTNTMHRWLKQYAQVGSKMVPCSIDSLDGNVPILLLGPIEITNYIIVLFFMFLPTHRFQNLMPVLEMIWWFDLTLLLSVHRNIDPTSIQHLKMQLDVDIEPTLKFPCMLSIDKRMDQSESEVHTVQNSSIFGKELELGTAELWYPLSYKHLPNLHFHHRQTDIRTPAVLLATESEVLICYQIVGYFFLFRW